MCLDHMNLGSFSRKCGQNVATLTACADSLPVRLNPLTLGKAL